MWLPRIRHATTHQFLTSKSFDSDLLGPALPLLNNRPRVVCDTLNCYFGRVLKKYLKDTVISLSVIS
uniref:Uncharacterized protein n=1 Tax=Arundo donax TaxID=35708 RepID=A0A0A9BAB0_ARUDO